MSRKLEWPVNFFSWKKKKLNFSLFKSVLFDFEFTWGKDNNKPYL